MCHWWTQRLSTCQHDVVNILRLCKLGYDSVLLFLHLYVPHPRCNRKSLTDDPSSPALAVCFLSSSCGHGLDSTSQCHLEVPLLRMPLAVWLTGKSF